MKTHLGKYSCNLKLDPVTASRHLCLSEGNMKATLRNKQPYPDHPERFDTYQQVMCGAGLTGRCYWEVEWEDKAYIGVTYRGIRETGDSDDCRLGGNDKSWSLDCSVERFTARHRNRSTAIRVCPSLCFSSSSSSSPSGRVAVYLDWPAGSLSFYSVSSDALIHLHTFTCTFTEPLHPAIGLDWGWLGCSASLCQTDVLYPVFRNTLTGVQRELLT
ncbi:stonustoxin subunit beta-like [Myripristis murdjan]|uniref:stonustoxin subunit beta-like n=1 Tax=Myripristis murdjan TaxID=586833 RepID=UPI001175EACA|nr:stonustoxin subunit beta-like [Myripristis murdjan]